MRFGAVAALLLLALVAGGCTRRVTVPKEKAPCATACGQSQNQCRTRCAADKGNPEVLEDIRESLCEKRCGEDYDKCMLACL